jgi:hypothetical protein
MLDHVEGAHASAGAPAGVGACGACSHLLLAEELTLLVHGAARDVPWLGSAFGSAGRTPHPRRRTTITTTA